MVFRLRNVLAMVVALVVLGSSSLGSVCELACGLPTADCHAAPPIAVSMESHDGMAMDGDCDHEMESAAVPVGTDGAASCVQQGCGHLVATVFTKDGPASSFATAVQWAITGVVPVDVTMVDGGVSGRSRPPLLRSGAGSLLSSLRV